jgi:anti-sigma factor RsiW
MPIQDTTLIEVRLLNEDDLKALAAGTLDVPTTEAVEAYLLHHPEAAGRVEAYRAAQRGTKAPEPHTPDPPH